MPASVPSKAAFIVCRDGDAVPPALTGAVAAIGNFDGLHRGHRSLIERAMQTDRPSAVVTFEPHPRLFFQPDKPLFLSHARAVKLAILQRIGLAGVSSAVSITHSHRSPLRPLSIFWRANLKLSGVWSAMISISGEGGRAILPSWSTFAAPGTRLHRHARHRRGSELVSSSAIRTALEQGDVEKANRLLGYRWFVRAEVRHGEKRGRDLGYPTANMRLPDDCRLRHGIYAVRAAIDGRRL